MKLLRRAARRLCGGEPAGASIKHLGLRADVEDRSKSEGLTRIPDQVVQPRGGSIAVSHHLEAH
jgi:hypothetical protein